LGFMHFADQSGGRSTPRIEVSQRNAAQTVGSAEVYKHLLDEPFASPVRIHWHTWMRFVNRRVARLAVERGGLRENDRWRAMSECSSQKIKRATDIVFEIRQWIAGRLADHDLAGEVHDGCKTMSCELRIEHRRVAQIANDQVAPADELAVSSRKIV